MNEVVEKTIDYIKNKQLGETTGHDWWHTYRVYTVAMEIAEAQTEPINKMAVALGALLHDIEDWKLNGGDETAGPKAAREWLESCGVEEDIIHHVSEIIYSLSYKGTETISSMKTLEGEIVQDADRLDAIGAIGIARVFAFGGVFNREIFNPAIIPRESLDSEEYKDLSTKSCSINHFYEKLLHIKDLMNTPIGKTIAHKRHDFIKDYLKVFLEECNCRESQHYKLLEKYE